MLNILQQFIPWLTRAEKLEMLEVLKTNPGFPESKKVPFLF